MGLNQLRKSRNIDIVFCIDGTSSMGPCIDNIRNHARTFYKDFYQSIVNDYNSDVDMLRVQIIVFRDLECDVEGLVKSRFFELPDENSDFERYLNGIKAIGGGDKKESGLEAIQAAMTTEFKAKGTNDRQVIILFTDTDAIDFGEKDGRTGYPTGLTNELFVNTWYCKLGNSNKLTERGKRMVMFAPAGSKYEELSRSLNRTVFKQVLADKGMSDISFDDILKILCASASSQS